MSPGLVTAFALAWIVHTLGALAFGVGLVFLLAWAIKTFSPVKLKAWGTWLVVIGILTCLLSVMALGNWHGKRFMSRGMMDKYGSSQPETVPDVGGAMEIAR